MNMKMKHETTQLKFKIGQFEPSVHLLITSGYMSITRLGSTPQADNILLLLRSESVRIDRTSPSSPLRAETTYRLDICAIKIMDAPFTPQRTTSSRWPVSAAGRNKFPVMTSIAVTIGETAATLCIGATKF
jgi:hypothetical protein